MMAAFYGSALVAVLTTLAVVLNTNPVHALLNLIVSFMAIAMLFFTLGAPFAGALEIIIYAGAIMVMVVFVVMMLNLGRRTEEQEQRWLYPGLWAFPASMAVILLASLGFTLFRHGGGIAMATSTQGPDDVGVLLFGPYVILVELIAFLLLAALVVASHIGQREDAPGATTELPAGETGDRP